jgi:hypothetical protein
MENIAAVTVDEVGDGGYFAFGIGAGDEENGGMVHGLASHGTNPLCKPKLQANKYPQANQRRQPRIEIRSHKNEEIRLLP